MALGLALILARTASAFYEGVVSHRYMSARFQQHTGLCFPKGLANRDDGEAAYAANLAALGTALDDLRDPSDPALAAVLSVPGMRGDLAPLESIAAEWRQRFDEIMVLGTGGSSLGGRALMTLADPKPGPRVRFLDNLDPHTFEGFLAGMNSARTGFLVISKSGGTADTIVQALVILDAVHSAGIKNPADRFLAVCEPGKSPLRSWAEAEGIRCLDHDPNLGGRYAVLSLVGLLPAMMAGLDAVAVREGADDVLQGVRNAPSPAEASPVAGAALSVALMQACGIRISVLMPYADRLVPFGLWHRQLWAESLGKRGQGSTPVHALGPVDQHSQLQLYLDGPADKFFTLLFPKVKGTGPRVPEASATAIGVGYLAGATAGDLVAAHQDATAGTLAANGRPTRVIDLPRLDERILGGLFMHFMLETILAAHLLQVNPFGQPAVEAGKVLARETLTELAAAKVTRPE